MTRIGTEESGAGHKPAVTRGLYLSKNRTLFPFRRLPSRGSGTMARRSSAAAFSKGAKDILQRRWAFHPTMATSAGLHRFDGRLPNYSPPARKRRKAEIRRHLRAIDLLA
ncbi:MAG: hypothetical protein AABY08_03435, partial [Candidatus Thermoplasmatota archaeon]